ncbi:hypothetical protein Droror1_Dr00026221 [Drosera rotundifolia]
MEDISSIKTENYGFWDGIEEKGGSHRRRRQSNEKSGKFDELGDILDRGKDEITILSLLRSLEIQARAKGEAVFQVNGNHETMNVDRDFRYVDSGVFDEGLAFMEYLDSYHDCEQAFLNWISISTKWKEERESSTSFWGPWSIIKMQEGVTARSTKLRPGGPLAVNWPDILLFLRLMTGSFVMEVFSHIMLHMELRG